MIEVPAILRSYDDFMSFTKQLETPRLIDGKYTCFLKNHPEAASHFYNQSHGALTLYCHAAGYAFLCISSIDDGSIVFIGPVESLEQSTVRIRTLLAEIETWSGWIPTEEQCRRVEKRCGVYWNR